jgi:ribonuclease HI
MEKVKIYTDGACKGNPGPGGYGCIIVRNDEALELKGGTKETTNNIMEMTAIIVALQHLKEPSEVELTTDSQYVVKGMTEWIDGWIRKNWVTASKQPVKNKDLWQKLLQLSEHHKIKWIWVRGHNGHPENERADVLANEGLAELY